MVKRKEAMRRGQFFGKMRESLTGAKTRVMRKLATQVQVERDTGRDVGMDSCDLASEENAHEMSTKLCERERLKVAQIDDALGRIAALKYGLCEVCGLEVAEVRLYAMPFTRLCCDCQQELEREAKTRRHYEEQNHEGYRLGAIRSPEESNQDDALGSQ